MAIGAADPAEQGLPDALAPRMGRWGGGARKIVWSASCITVAVVSLGLLSAGFAASRAGYDPPAGGFSWGKNGVVMPISLRNALPEKVTTVPIWLFQPNRPTRG